MSFHGYIYASIQVMKWKEKFLKLPTASIESKSSSTARLCWKQANKTYLGTQNLEGNETDMRDHP